jgi:hypothetical protein
MAKKELTVYIRAKNMLARGLKSAKAKLSSFASGVASSIKKAAIAFGVFAGAIAAASKLAVEAYQKQAQAEAKLSAVLKTTGYAAGFTSSELKKYAAELQKTTGFGDELTISMMGILASFKQVKGDSFKRATVAILDMGAAMGKAGKGSADVESAVIQVGKALNDPIKGISALSRVGVTFTEQQKDQIKALQESGRMMEAQAIILKELESEFGGTAEEMNKASKGINRLKNSWGDLKESVGAAIAETDSFEGVLNSISQVLEDLASDGYIELWAENVKLAIEEVTPAVSGVGKAFGWMKKQVEGASAFYGAISAGEELGKAINMMDSIPEKIRKERKARLEAIKEEIRLRKKAIEEQEKAQMKLAQSEQAIQDAKNDGYKNSIDDIESELDEYLKADSVRQKSIDELKKKWGSLNKEKLNAEKEAKRAAIQSLNEQISKQRELAKMTVSAFMDKQKASDKEKQALDADAKRAAKIRSDRGRGKFATGDQKRANTKFLDAFSKIEEARKGMPGLEAKLGKEKEELTAMEGVKTLKSINQEITAMRKDITKIMTAG